MAGKKKKLPKDLKDASAMALSYVNVISRIKEACNVLKSVNMTEFQTSKSVDLSRDNALLFLIAQYGIEDVLKVSSVLSTLPEEIPTSQKERTLTTVTEISNTNTIANFITRHLPGLPSILGSVIVSDSPIVLAPPTAVCLECNKSLVFNHKCNVSS